jgi:hypothetical protein
VWWNFKSFGDQTDRPLVDEVVPKDLCVQVVLMACETEAKVLEAIGQHYLQDAWSMGHLWER